MRHSPIPLALPPALDAFLDQARRRGHAWGEHDCMLFPADWVQRLCGQDPANGVRGLYAGRAEAEAILAARGGIVRLAMAGMRAAGWKRRRFTRARAGDVGILLLHGAGKPHPFGAIALGQGRWALVTARGLRILGSIALIAWTPPHG